MSTLRSVALPVALVVAALAGAGARGTTVDLPSFEELVRQSEVIARVRVLDQRVEQPVAGAAAGRARTWTTLVVTDALAGAVVAERLVLFQPGDASTNAAGVVGQPVHRVGDPSLGRVDATTSNSIGAEAESGAPSLRRRERLQVAFPPTTHGWYRYINADCADSVPAPEFRLCVWRSRVKRGVRR